MQKDLWGTVKAENITRRRCKRKSKKKKEPTHNGVCV